MGNGKRPFRHLTGGRVACGVICALLLAGCSAPARGPIVFYLDGAGWYSSSGSVKQGLRDAGYMGQFDTFSWSAYLGPAHDHLITAKSRGVARRLARKITRARRDDPERKIHVLGLSAGTAVILFALKQLPGDVAVDNAVLFSPSVSARHDLTPVMRHVRGRLYATSSPHDRILGSLAVNADGLDGRPAGVRGFALPSRAGPDTTSAYQRVVNLLWKPSYLGFDWAGGHTSVTGRRFVESVIAPRLLASEAYPLDRPVVRPIDVARGGGQ